jgi:hypothetical protein
MLQSGSFAVQHFESGFPHRICAAGYPVQSAGVSPHRVGPVLFAGRLECAKYTLVPPLMVRHFLSAFPF